MSERKRVMSIHLNSDGTINVEGVAGEVRSGSLDELSKSLLRELKKKPMRKWEQISVLTTNPCAFVNIGGRYKWVCW